MYAAYGPFVVTHCLRLRADGANVPQPGHAGPMRAIVAWILAPTEKSQRSRGVGLAGLRVLVGPLWLYNVVWKLPPEFGRDTGGQLYGYVQGAVDDPFFPPYSWVLEQLVLPNFGFFGWVVLVVESLLAAFLIAWAVHPSVGFVGRCRRSPSGCPS